MAERREYQSPEVRALGDVRVLTQRNVNGTRTDKTYPAGTPLNQLTFSA